MLSKKGFKKEKEFEGDILLIENDLVFKCYYILNSNIKKFEKEVWRYNSDPDFNEIPLWKCYTIEDNDYIIGYAIISTRYIESNKNIIQKLMNKSVKYLDIEDFVMMDTKRVARIMSKGIDVIMNDIKKEKFKGILINPNEYSKPFVKRLKQLGLPIKYHNYPSFQPIGYENVKEL